MLQCCKCERILRKSEKHFTPYCKFHLGSFLKDIIYEMDATKFVRTLKPRKFSSLNFPVTISTEPC